MRRQANSQNSLYMNAYMSSVPEMWIEPVRYEDEPGGEPGIDTQLEGLWRLAAVLGAGWLVVVVLAAVLII